jgi:hypothetical protein
MKIKLIDIYSKANQRPEGYVNDIISAGVVNGNALEIEYNKYVELLTKYQPTTKAPKKPCGCTTKTESTLPIGQARPANFPPITTQLTNATKAVGRVIQAKLHGEPVEAGSELIDSRRSICSICDKFKNGRCLLCGCRLEWKIKLLTEICPDKPPKW